LPAAFFAGAAFFAAGFAAAFFFSATGDSPPIQFLFHEKLMKTFG
jgi:hypothetical protein